MPLPNYDEVYSRPEFYWGREPNRMCETAIDLWPARERKGKKVVDLGCGEGRDLLQFARKGFAGLGVDLSAPGLAKVQRWAAEEGLSVQTIQASLQEFRLGEPVDLVYSSGTLAYVPHSLRPDVFANYRANTKVGGYNVLNVFVEKPYLPVPHDWGTDEHFYRTGELLTYYWDWEIVDFTEFEFDCTSGGKEHRHAIELMIAKKILP